MNKTELVAAMAVKAGITGADAKRALEAFIETVIEEVNDGAKVAVAGLGSFEKVLRKERTGINPQTKKKITIEAKHSPKFKAAKAFKDLVA